MAPKGGEALKNRGVVEYMKLGIETYRPNFITP